MLTTNDSSLNRGGKALVTMSIDENALSLTAAKPGEVLRTRFFGPELNIFVDPSVQEASIGESIFMAKSALETLIQVTLVYFIQFG